MPFSVTLATVAAKEKTSAAAPSSASSAPKATIAHHLSRKRSIAAPRLCGFGSGFEAFDMRASSTCCALLPQIGAPLQAGAQRARLSSPSTWAAYSTIGTMRP